ncbi:hypothetical protein SAMN05421739_11136 [Pontibacter chinhatensis]|uniref:Uncharacterized protein n=1 Tax=Pontibacter chinhatensis TaxID=1436961 RepID=A0A1I2Z3F7_9BACT|nr:hypothetical protein SAMN05421739_11136 [Pontibacter chinhatensis]
MQNIKDAKVEPVNYRFITSIDLSKFKNVNIICKFYNDSDFRISPYYKPVFFLKP